MRRPASIPRFVAVVAALASVAPSARAHDFCLLPDTAAVASGTPFSIAMRLAGRFPGEPVAWRTGRVNEFFITDARGRTDIETPILAGDPPAARLTLRGPGTAVIGLSTAASYVEMPAAEFETYLREEGHDAALRARAAAGRSDAAGRERFTRHVKTLINAGGPNSSVALSRTGLTLEIVPEEDLARLRPGGRLRVRVFYRGDPDVDDQVCVAGETPAPGGTPAGGDGPYAWCGRLDGAGRIAIPIASAGWQMIRATRMIPIRDDPKADWHSYWSAMTFRVEAPDAGGAAATPKEPEAGTTETPTL